MNSLNEQNEEQDEQDDKNHDITINSSKTNNPSEELISIIEKSFVNSDGILSASDYLNRKFDDIKLSDSKIKSLKKEHLQKIILDKVLGAFKIGDVILAVKDWNKSVNDDITQKKRDILLATYFSKTDDIEDKINKLKCFITNIYGNTIFNTILKIIDEKPLDRELLFHLSNVLKICLMKILYVNLNVKDMH